MPNTYNYLYALTYVDFDNENKDILYFKNQSAKDSFFSLSTLFANAKEINFEKKNLIDVDLIVTLDDHDEVEKEFNFNYCILKEISTSNYYYYFVNKMTYLNKGRMTIKCHLDVFTTYFDKLVFEGTINRGTLREFVKDGTDIIYDSGAYTHIFAVDDTYSGKKFIQHDKCLQPHVYTYLDNATLDAWLDENVECWQYLFVDCNHQYKYDNTNYRSVDEFLSDGISTSFGVLAMPIYKTTKLINIRFRDVSDPNNPKTFTISMRDSAIDYFRKSNNDNSYVYSSKISKQPPFTPIISNSDTHNFLCTITDSGNLIMDFGDVSGNDLSPLLQNYTRVFVTHELNSQFYIGMFEMTFQTKRFYNNNVSSIIDDYFQTRMTKTKYLSNSTEFWKYPNATSIKNIEIKLTYNGQEFTTTTSKIDSGDAVVEMLESITPDISKTYVRWKHTGYYAFRSANSKTLTGGIYSDDTLLSLGTTKLQEVLANSKNFFYQKRVNIGVNSLINLATNTAKQDVLGMGKTLAKEQLQEVNFGFEMDNLENAPSHLEKASGNGLFNLLTKDFGIHLEVWMMTEEDLTNIAMYYNKFGVQTNTIGTIFDILEKHKYFDYTEFDTYYIHGTVNITNEIKDEFKRKLKRGVRFWYDSSKLYNYSLYNYENALE